MTLVGLRSRAVWIGLTLIAALLAFGWLPELRLSEMINEGTDAVVDYLFILPVWALGYTTYFVTVFIVFSLLIFIGARLVISRRKHRRIGLQTE